VCVNDPDKPLSSGALRARFRREGIDAVRLGTDPLAAFVGWHADWIATSPFDPALMTLATVDVDGAPSLRVMDLAAVDHGFIFMTHGESPKSQDLKRCPKAALCFSWPEIGRQIRVSGTVERLGDAEATAAFEVLPRSIRLVAHATKQSARIQARAEIEQRLLHARTVVDVDAPPLPADWQGCRLIPHRMEFWQQRPDDLQDRILFDREDGSSVWRTSRLSP